MLRHHSGLFIARFEMHFLDSRLPVGESAKKAGKETAHSGPSRSSWSRPE